MPLDELIGLLELTSISLKEQFEEVAMDEAAYHRQFWTHWQKLPVDISIAAMNRECEMECQVRRESVILSTSLRESLIAKQQALIAVVAARSR